MSALPARSLGTRQPGAGPAPAQRQLPGCQRCAAHGAALAMPAALRLLRRCPCLIWLPACPPASQGTCWTCLAGPQSAWSGEAPAGGASAARQPCGLGLPAERRGPARGGQPDAAGAGALARPRPARLLRSALAGRSRPAPPHPGGSPTCCAPAPWTRAGPRCCGRTTRAACWTARSSTGETCMLACCHGCSRCAGSGGVRGVAFPESCELRRATDPAGLRASWSAVGCSGAAPPRRGGSRRGSDDEAQLCCSC